MTHVCPAFPLWGCLPCESKGDEAISTIYFLVPICSTTTPLFPKYREAGELRQLLAEGVAPKPPKFWSAKPGHPDVGQDEDALTDELLLCWRPQQGSAVGERQGRRTGVWEGGTKRPTMLRVRIQIIFKDNAVPPAPGGVDSLFLVLSVPAIKALTNLG